MPTPPVLRNYKGAMRELGYYYSSFGMNGVLAVIHAKIAKENRHYKVEQQGILFPFYLRLQTSDIKTFEQVFIQNFYDFASHKTPGVIIDAGANIGLVSIVFANRFPNARIITIEPEESNYKMLQRNVAQYGNIIPMQAALWDTNEQINLLDPGFGEWGFRTQRNDYDVASHTVDLQKVQGVTVDRIMDDFGMEVIDILKIDIEGAESEVFMNPSLWIDRVNMLIVELHDRFKEGCSQNVQSGMQDFDLKWREGGNDFAIRKKFHSGTD